MKPKQGFSWYYMKKCDVYNACARCSYHHCFRLYIYACAFIPAGICVGIRFFHALFPLQLELLLFWLFHKMCWWIEKTVTCQEMSGAWTEIQDDCKHRVHDQPSWHDIKIYYKIHYVVLTDAAYRLVLSILSLNLCYSTHTVLSVSSNGASKWKHHHRDAYNNFL